MKEPWRRKSEMVHLSLVEVLKHFEENTVLEEMKMKNFAELTTWEFRLKILQLSSDYSKWHGPLDTLKNATVWTFQYHVSS
jgi:hypothetical protein